LVTQAPLDEHSAFDAVMSLTEKSLVTTEVSEQMARHRLLHTTRAYAYEKLTESTDIPAIWHWHARHHWDLLRTAEDDWETLHRTAWVRKYAPAIDDVRAALDWAFAADGDVVLGAEITLTAVPFAFQMALQDEFRERLETASRLLSESQLETGTLSARLHQAWKLLSLDHQRLNPDAAPETDENNTPGQSLVNATTLEIEAGRYDLAVRKARQMAQVAQRSGQPMALLLSERLMAQVLHFNGQHREARVLAQQVLQQADKAIALAHQPLAVDRRVSMRIVLARIAWMEGSFYRARQIVDQSLEYAADDSPFSLCQALALAACPIAFWQGDYPRARSLTARLLEETARYRLGYWRTYGEWYERAGAVSESNPAPSSDFPLSGLLLDTLLTIDPERVPAPSRNQPRELTPSWCAPELLRVQGETLLRGGTAESVTRAEALFVKAADLARVQGALGWQLRAATSLASLWHETGRGDSARQVLSAARHAIQQEHDSRDMIKARELHARLG
jgi:tetratricopeptide (TPR) repeat protein